MTKTEKKLLTIILVVLAIMMAFNYIRVQIAKEPKYKVVTPFGKSINIFSFFNKKVVKPKKIIYGYLPYWALHNTQYIQLDKLTDIAYFGLYLNADGSFMTKLEDGTIEPGFNNWKNNEELRTFIAQAKESGVRVSLTIMSHDDEISDKFLDCQDCWKTLYTNLENELKYHNLEDVNLNFEYAGFTDPTKKDQYSNFVKYIADEMHKNYPGSFVVVATFADSVVKPRVTDIANIGKTADGIFIMGYDFHRPDSDNAGPVSPIDGIGERTEYDIRTMLKDYLANVPPNKIILGVPYYGYNWLVEKDEDYAKRKPGNEISGFSQSQAYADIMDTILELQPEIKWDEIGKVPYFTYVSPETKEIREVYFENEQSLDVKYKLVLENNLAGVGIWALGYDGGYQELWNLLAKAFISK